MRLSTKKIIIGLVVMSFLWMMFLSNDGEQKRLEQAAEPTPTATASATPTAEPTPSPTPTPETRRAGEDYGDETEAYFKDQFMIGCRSGSSEAGCSCMYDYIRSRHSVEQIVEIGNNTDNPENAKVFYQAAIVCEESL